MTAEFVSCLQSVKTYSGNYYKLEIWVNAQHDGRPAEYRWRPMFKATKFG